MSVQTAAAADRTAAAPPDAATETPAAGAAPEGRRAGWNAVPVTVVPAGFELLDGGVARTVRVNRFALGLQDSRPFYVTEGSGEGEYVVDYYREVRVLGPSELVHDAEYEHRGRKGKAEVRTTAALLVRA
jgi:hypothetical protein